MLADPNNLADLPHEKHFKSRFSSKGSPIYVKNKKAKDFMSSNMKNTGAIINRLNP